VSEKISVKIPPGVDSGSHLRLQGKGDVGDIPGDLYVGITVRTHPKFHRQGNDVLTRLSLTYSQLVLGDQVTLETLEGTEPLTVPPGTQIGQPFVLKGKGMPLVNRPGRGDFAAIVALSVPANLSEDYLELIRQISKLEKGL
jgi:molecular chaperone DnaJ